MATEPNLRDLFRSAGSQNASAIDTEAVIRRSRRRRLPAQVGVGGIATLAIGGIGFVGVQGLGSVRIASSASDSSVMSEESAQEGTEGTGTEGTGTGPASGFVDSGIKRAPADRLNLCGGTLAEVAPSATGLVLTPGFPDSPADGAPVSGTVTLTNTGAETVTGYSAASPAITLSQNGIVLWHSNGPMIQLAQEVALAPGESMEYQTSFTPVACAVEDDLAESFRENLPAVPAGDYQVSAAADISLDGTAELVTGPTQTVRIG